MDFDWHSDTGMCGWKLMMAFAAMPLEKLGFPADALEFGSYPIQRWIGAGSSAAVYELGRPEGRLPTVLKVFTQRQGDASSNRAISRGEESTTARKDLAASEADELVDLNKPLAAAGSTDTSAGAYDTSDIEARIARLCLSTADALRHIPRLLSRKRNLLELCPKAKRLTGSELKLEHVEQLFRTLYWIRCTKHYLHGDLSHRNVMLAPSNWRDGITASDDGQLVLVLFDSGFARPIDETGSVDEAKSVNGTPVSMSQRSLEACDGLLAGEFTDYRYSIADELESAVKTALLIAWPSF
eukprot:TRINITY_DN12487_c1_g6_i1.p1 TRINITY_DN12487_c1_g6~~TRINITY_DN12487_c1_g6_i1.p1  ORF type:complete len:298 (+),score=47.34 TRINITY_DN12487_c1_g6_i1:1026-1919(+)